MTAFNILRNEICRSTRWSGATAKAFVRRHAHSICVLYQVPRTAQSVVLLANIKQALFPELDVEQFLALKAAFELTVEEAYMMASA